MLTNADGDGWARAAETAASAFPDVPLFVHRVGAGALRDPDGTFAEMYGIGADGTSLIRPDGFVAWRSARARPDAAADLRGVLARILMRDR